MRSEKDRQDDQLCRIECPLCGGRRIEMQTVCQRCSEALAKSNRLLHDWAAVNGYKLQSASYCRLQRGPFLWTTSTSQTIYRVTVTDPLGQTRTGWARCGGFWRGLASARVEVRWDDSLGN